MAEKQLTSFRIKHEAILQYMLANPDKTQFEVADHFGISWGWLSVIVNSDLFQEKRREREDELFKFSVRDRLEAVAYTGLDKTEQLLSSTQSLRDASDATDKALARLGYGSQGAGAAGGGNTLVQQNFFQASPEQAARARAMIGQEVPPNVEATQGGEVIDGEASAVTPVQTNGTKRPSPETGSSVREQGASPDGEGV